MTKSNSRFAGRIHPICLPMSEPIRCQSFAGSGSSFVGGKQSRYLMQTQMPVLNETFCEEVLIKRGFEYTELPND